MAINWNQLANAYEAAPDEPARWDAFQNIIEAVAADPDLPDGADFTAGAIEFLRSRNLWND